MKDALAQSEGFRDMIEHKITPEELYKMFNLEGGIEMGLTAETARKRLAVEGENRLTEKPAIPWYIMFLKQLTGLFSLLLWFGAILCFIGYSVDQSDPSNLYLGIVLTVVVIITGIFSYTQESKSASIMAKFKNFVPPKCTVIRDNGQKSNVEASQIVRGDVCILEAGCRIPADLRVMYSNEMKVDNSSLTGESDPLLRTTECTNDDNPLESDNLAFFGTLVKEGNGLGIVVAVGDGTIIGRIAHLAQSATTEDTPLKKEIHYFIKIISSVAVILGVTFFILGFVFGYEPISNLIFMIGIIVANVPEGLLATVTVSLALTAKRMAVKHVMVKNLESVETLGSTTCICSDKTGTLT
jgi:sodium/potassium-transporting ATPase subunit alpha